MAIIIDYELSFEEYLCKFGFEDGNNIIDDCYIYRNIVVKCLNESFRKYKVGHVKAIKNDGYDMHNQCFISFTAEKGKEFEFEFNSELSHETHPGPNIKSCKKLLGKVRFERFLEAIKYASEMFDKEVRKQEEIYA